MTAEEREHLQRVADDYYAGRIGVEEAFKRAFRVGVLSARPWPYREPSELQKKIEAERRRLELCHLAGESFDGKRLT